jgi:hypothetical protein
MDANRGPPPNRLARPFLPLRERQGGVRKRIRAGCLLQR